MYTHTAVHMSTLDNSHTLITYLTTYWLNELTAKCNTATHMLVAVDELMPKLSGASTRCGLCIATSAPLRGNRVMREVRRNKVRCGRHGRARVARLSQEGHS